MISKDISIVDLDPYTWRNLGEVTNMIFPHKNTVYVLHDKGEIINILDSKNGILNAIEFNLKEQETSVKDIFNKYEHVEEVRVFNKSSLINYYSAIQVTDFRDLDTDEYISFTLNLLNNFKGIDTFKRGNSKMNIYDCLRNYVNNRLPEDCLVTIIIFDIEEIYFNVILGFKKHKLELITTLDNPQTEGLKTSISINSGDECSKFLEKKFGVPVKCIFIGKLDFCKFISEYV